MVLQWCLARIAVTLMAKTGDVIQWAETMNR
jgi:hypothetical protein